MGFWCGSRAVAFRRCRVRPSAQRKVAVIGESMKEMGWNVAETAVPLGCERGTLSRVLNGRAGVSANMALALEDIGWGTAEHWMRMQASYALAQARRSRGTEGFEVGTGVA